MNGKGAGFIFLITFCFVNFFLLCPYGAVAQEKPQRDSTQSKIPIIVVVPFNPTMYFGDTDHFISDATGIPSAEIRMAFRATLANNIDSRLDVSYFSVNLLTQKDDQSRELLQKIYRSQVYTEKFRSIISHRKLTSSWKINNIFRGKRYEWGITCIEPDPPMPYKKGKLAQTALLDLRSQQVLTTMKELYDADYVLFLNQFRMQTRYKKCLDIRNNVYQRDYLLSITLLTMEGKTLTEGVVGTTYQSNTNNLRTILEKNITPLEGFTASAVRDGLKSQVKCQTKSY